MSLFKKIFKKFSKSASDDTITASTVVADKTNTDTNETNSNSENKNTLSNELINASFLEEFEEQLIKSDLGVELTLDFIQSLKNSKNEIKQNQIPELLKDFLLDAFKQSTENDPNYFKLKLNPSGPSIILVVGVNGVGKTTSIGKLAYKLKNEGHKVLIAAGDTFRAAAEDQLKIWAQRSGTDYIQLDPGAKSSAVVFKAIEKINQENHDVLIIDTAGRLQNKKNLMEELSKIKNVIDKNAPGCLSETMLVLDATTGQNALSQAKSFTDVCDLSSIILTKFDGSARAGMIFSIAHNLKIPVKLVGTGEGINDFKDFKPEEFIAKYL